MTKSGSEAVLSYQEAWDLIPWYVNGTLDPAEEAAVEAQLMQHADLRQELAEQRRLAKGVSELDTMDMEMESAFSRLSKQLEEPPPASVASFGQSGGQGRGGGLDLLGWLRSWLSGLNARLLLPLGAAVAALALVLVLQPLNQEEAPFKTLTDPGSAVVSGESLTVKAVQGSDAEALSRLFEAQGLSPVSGPSAKGVYILSVPEGGDAAALAKTLAESPLVDFASPR